MNPKRLQLLKEAIPRLRRIVVLVPGGHPLRDQMVREIEATAAPLGVTLLLQEAHQFDPSTNVEEVLKGAVANRADAILGLQGPLYFRERQRICDFALRHRLPGMFELAEYTQAGCLLSYSTSLADLSRRSAGYVDKILKGAKPTDLPVEQPTKFELVINMKTARALGLTIPPSLLLRADQIVG